jgi:hypothetical protein
MGEIMRRPLLGRVAAVVACGGVLLTLAACGGDKKPEPPATVASGATGTAGATDAGGTPKGGWPQGAGGVLDKKMCGILTQDDFSKFHMITTSKVEDSDFAPENKPIGVSCNYSLDDRLSLGLFATPAAAHALYAKFAEFKGAAAASVAGADESVFGADPTLPDGYRFCARRGKLIIYFNFSPTINKLTPDQARTAANGIGTLVLSRAPHLGS